jgi:hypothetical protein
MLTFGKLRIKPPDRIIGILGGTPETHLREARK